MSISLVFNTFGEDATAQGIVTGSTASGYDITKLISGPRSTWWRSAATSSEIIPYYDSATAADVDTCVIARADKLLTKETAYIYAAYNTDRSSTFTSLSGHNPLASSSLVGILSQDLVITFTSTSVKRAGVKFKTLSASGSEAAMFSKLYFGAAFSFGTEPQIGAMTEHIEERVAPLRGYGTYQTEARFTLVWSKVTQAKIKAFEALAVGQPLFLHDSDADLLPYKLEHCVIADPWRRYNSARDLYTIELTLRRLKHYDD